MAAEAGLQEGPAAATTKAPPPAHRTAGDGGWPLSLAGATALVVGSIVGVGKPGRAQRPRARLSAMDHQEWMTTGHPIVRHPPHDDHQGG